MCGIAGFLDTARDRNAARLGELVCAMTGAVAHRGPDDVGHWVDAAAGVALGHRRLSIIDVSPMGHQPMVSRDGSLVLVYNGELYNSAQLRVRLEQRGVRFAGHSDTEVLLESLAELGVEETLRAADGMFAFAVWDRTRRRLVLARDRVGEKPLYWGWQGGTLLFGSELKSLTRHPRFCGRLDRGAAAGMLRYGFVPGPWSIYEGVSKLPQGSWVVVDPERPGSEQVSTYWSFREVAEGQSAVRRARRSGPGRDTAHADRETVDELEELLRTAVRSRMTSDVPLGAFLSGGIDSSVVVALMQAQSDAPVKTFTIGFHDDVYDEARHAEAVAAHLGTEHTLLRVSPQQALDVVPQLPTMFDEPFADASQIPTYLLSVLARGSVKVALSGDGGDELFAGYVRYLFNQSVWQRMSRVPGPLRSLGARAIRGVPPARWDGAARLVSPLLPPVLPTTRLGERMHRGADLLAARDPEQVYRPLRSHWQDPASLVLGGVEHRDAVVDPRRWARLDEPTERLMYLDSVTFLPDDVLTKLDRAAMATSLETRVPLLDPRVISFAWGLPLEDKIRGTAGKWPLRAVLHRYVPPALVERPKMGFGVPVGDWVRGPLRDWSEEVLDPHQLRQDGLLDADQVRQRWDEHLSGTRDWTYALWDVLMLVSWYRARDADRAEHGQGCVA